MAMLRPMLAARASLSQQYAVLHKMVLDIIRSEPTCPRLMTVPGVGALTAIPYLTTIDDPARFRHSRDVGAHLGLTPRKYASGEIDRNGGISKCGDALLRATLHQAALALLTRTQRWSTLRAWGMAVETTRLAAADVAVARKLAIVLHRIWADGSEFRWSRQEVIA
jgi:transposase